MDWTTEQIVELSQLWHEGLAASEIGRRLGTTKSAAVGKAHRLKLPGRPSPVKRRDRANRDHPGPAPGSLGRPAVPAFNGRPRSVTPKPAGPVAPPRAPDEARVARYAAMGTEKKPCLWPLGDPGAPDYRTCGADRVVGKPYCAAHCAGAFVRAPKPDEQGSEAA